PRVRTKLRTTPPKMRGQSDTRAATTTHLPRSVPPWFPPRRRTLLSEPWGLPRMVSRVSIDREYEKWAESFGLSGIGSNARHAFHAGWRANNNHRRKKENAEYPVAKKRNNMTQRRNNHD